MNLQQKADQIRQDVIRVAFKNKAGHIAPSLSCIEILVALHYQIMGPNDKFILSKAHGGYGLYAILADQGILPKNDWEKFNLPGCVEQDIPGIVAGCGSLGHGLPIATGLAWSLKLQEKPGHVYCLMGDGETQEGTTWESCQFIVKHQLNNLTIIIDKNNLQAMDFIHNIMDSTQVQLYHRFDGFGIKPTYIHGHNLFVILDSLSRKSNSPRVLLALTFKGWGLPCMRDMPKFHYRIPACAKL